MGGEPQSGIYSMPHPDKHGQLYFLVRKTKDGWIAEGDQGKSYKITYENGNEPMPEEHIPYYLLTRVPDQTIPTRLSKISQEARQLANRQSFLEKIVKRCPLLFHQKDVPVAPSLTQPLYTNKGPSLNPDRLVGPGSPCQDKRDSNRVVR